MRRRIRFRLSSDRLGRQKGRASRLQMRYSQQAEIEYLRWPTRSTYAPRPVQQHEAMFSSRKNKNPCGQPNSVGVIGQIDSLRNWSRARTLNGRTDTTRCDTRSFRFLWLSDDQIDLAINAEMQRAGKEFVTLGSLYEQQERSRAVFHLTWQTAPHRDSRLKATIHHWRLARPRTSPDWFRVRCAASIHLPAIEL